MTVQELIDLLQQIPDKETRQVVTGGMTEALSSTRMQLYGASRL